MVDGDEDVVVVVGFEVENVRFCDVLVWGGCFIYVCEVCDNEDIVVSGVEMEWRWYEISHEQDKSAEFVMCRVLLLGGVWWGGGE